MRQFQFDPTTKIVYKVESAHDRAIYLKCSIFAICQWEREPNTSIWGLMLGGNWREGIIAYKHTPHSFKAYTFWNSIQPKGFYS